MAYASQYYDPAKAHEYYERTKQLKGRKSTSGLNEQGKIAAKYVKEKLTEERKKKQEELKQRMNAKIERIREKIKAIKGNKGNRKAIKEKLRKMIADLRAEYKTQKTKIKEEYDEKYVQELDKIKQDSGMQKAKKAKKKKKSKK